ncbi:unnamed protein product, partial [Allacma fusca]
TSFDNGLGNSTPGNTDSEIAVGTTKDIGGIQIWGNVSGACCCTRKTFDEKMYSTDHHRVRHQQHKELRPLELFNQLIREIISKSRRYTDRDEDLGPGNESVTTMKGITQNILALPGPSVANLRGLNSSDIQPNYRSPTAASYLGIVTQVMNRSSEAQNTTTTLVSFQRLMYSNVIPLMLLFCFLSSVINLFIVLSARWCRKPMSPTLYFSLSLALADAYASCILGTGLIVNSLLPKVYGVDVDLCLSLAIEAFRLGGVLVTVAHLLAMSVNYWIGIARPLQYAATMTRRTAYRLIVACWVLPIAILLAWFASVPGEGFQSPKCKNNTFLHKQHFRTIIAGFFFAPLLLMSGMYIHILIIVRKHIRSNLKYPNSLQLRRNVKAIITTCFILGAYIVGWMPAIIWFVLVCENDCIFIITEIPLGVRVPINISINILVILKAFVDPIIYAARMTDIKVALQKMRYDFFFWFFQSCAPAKSTPKPGSDVRRYIGYTKSHHASSQISSSRCNV